MCFFFAVFVVSGLLHDRCRNYRIWISPESFGCCCCFTTSCCRDSTLGEFVTHKRMASLTSSFPLSLSLSLHSLPPSPFSLSPQTVVHHVILWGSVVVTFVINYVYTAIDSRQAMQDTFWIMQRASTRAEFWLVLLVTPLIALIPRLAWLTGLQMHSILYNAGVVPNTTHDPI